MPTSADGYFEAKAHPARNPAQKDKRPGRKDVRLRSVTIRHPTTNNAAYGSTVAYVPRMTKAGVTAATETAAAPAYGPASPFARTPVSTTVAMLASTLIMRAAKSTSNGSRTS